jgi:transposase
MVRHEEQRTKDDAEQLAQLRMQHADVAEAIDLAQDFAHLVHQRQARQLEPWLARRMVKKLMRRFVCSI